MACEVALDQITTGRHYRALGLVPCLCRLTREGRVLVAPSPLPHREGQWVRDPRSGGLAPCPITALGGRCLHLVE